MLTEICIRGIAEDAISYLYDNDLLNDFLYDRGVYFGEEERQYFGIPDEPDEEDDYE